jgi:hypothetical protein
MVKARVLGSALLVVTMMLATPERALPAAPAHVVVIVMENHEYSHIIGNPNAPYINSLASTFALATEYHAVSHPSLPNYLALTGGSTFGITEDCLRCHVAGDYLGDQMIAGSVPWTAYIENVYPDSTPPCRFREGKSHYDKAHNPWSYYDDLQNDPAQCVLVQPYETSFDPANMPEFAWITPNSIHDMHDGTVAEGDAWLAANVPPIIANMSGSDVLFLVWDEGTTDKGGGGHVVAIAAGPGAKMGFQDPTAYNHYGLLLTIEELLGLPCLRHACAAQAMTNMLSGTPPPSL